MEEVEEEEEVISVAMAEVEEEEAPPEEEEIPAVEEVAFPQRLRFLGGEGKRGRKYFLTGKVGGALFHQVCDTAADISLIPRRVAAALGVQEIPLHSPFRVDGFQGTSSPEVRITTKCRVISDLGGGVVLPVEYYVAPIDSQYALLGSDVLGDASSSIRFESSSGILEFNGHLFYTKRSRIASTVEMRRRMQMSKSAFHRQYKVNHSAPLMRSSRRVVIRPRSVAWIDAHISGQSVSRCHSFLSHYADTVNQVTIPNFAYFKKRHRYQLPVFNDKSSCCVLTENQILGDVIQLEKEPSVSASRPTAFHLIAGSVLQVEKEKDEKQRKMEEHLEQQRRRRRRRRKTGEQQQQQHQQHQQQQQQHDEQRQQLQHDQQQQQQQQQQRGKSVRFSDIKDVDRLDSGTLQDIHTHGIVVEDTPAVSIIDEKQFLKLAVDVAEERKKGAASTMWNDRTEEEYLSQFKRNTMVTDEYFEKWKTLLLDFRHVFYNPKKPEMFSGLNMRPVEVHAIPGTVPKKDRLRRQSDVKEPYILEHLEKLEKEGVIKKASDLSAGFLSNVVLVLESRYVANLGKEVVKSRFCLDFRLCNRSMLDAHWHLPNMDDFRRSIASGGFKVFTNLDATAFFYQHKISDRSSRLFSGFWAANRLWVMTRLAMGWKVSPSHGQFWMDKAFEEHDHCKPFMDDLSIYSMSMDEMLDSDLPLCLAICSVYNLLLAPAKAEICTDSLRVLGFELSEGARGISSEKVEKIKNLQFPETKPELISALAFFSWFLSCNPKLSDALGPLRDLAKDKVRFIPTQVHRDAFEAAKARLLDPALGRLRSPSSRLEDNLIVATDSSHYALGVVILQHLPPTSAEVAEGVPADAKQLYIVQVFSKSLPPEKRCAPIWIKEFFALDLAVDKFDFLLRARPFTVLVDNKVLRYWANLEKMDDAMTRRVLKLQTYDFRVLFVETRIQPADQFSRWEKDDHQDGVYHERFLQGRILNGYGKEVPIESLFCDETKKELQQYFCDGKRTTQSDFRPNEPQRPTDQPVVEMSERKDTRCSATSRAAHDELTAEEENDSLTLEEQLDRQSLALLPRKRKFDAQRKIHRQRRATKRWARRSRTMDDEQKSNRTITRSCQLCQGCVPLGGQGEEQTIHCSCLCARNGGIDAPSVALVQLSDNDVASGRMQSDDNVTDDVLSTHPFPRFDDATLAAIKTMQSDDSIQEMISYVSGAAEKPDKQASLILPAEWRAFFRHFRLFGLSPQQVLLRQWTSSEGGVRWLLVLSDEELHRLLVKTHEFRPETVAPTAGGRRRKDVGERETRAVHTGINRTLTTLGAHYYHHSMRQIITDYVRKCAVCVLNNHPRGKRDAPGLHSPTAPGVSIACDFAGPWNSETDFKFLFCAVDLFSRYSFVFPTKSTKDSDVVACLLEMRKEWSGLPRRLHMDSAICQSRSVSTQLLSKLGVELTHSMPHNSACQSKVERFIGTISRSILKLRTASSSTPFNQLVDEARISYNNTCTENLGGRCPSDLHFFRSNANIIDPDGSFPLSGLTGDSRTAAGVVAAKRAAQDAVLHNDVRRFQMRREKENVGDADDKLKVGQFAFKKRTSFWGSIPRKLQFRLDEDAFEVVGKIATNSFKCVSIVDGETVILPGDQLVRTTLSRDELKALLERMRRLREGSAHVSFRRSTRATTRTGNDVVALIDAPGDILLSELFDND